LREGKELELHARLRGQRGGRQDQNQMGSELSEKRSGFPTYFQTDTVIKPRDCGGPVCDLEGHVIGINIARVGRVESFSIPSPSLTALLPDLKSGKFSPDLVALRKKIAELKTLVKKTVDEKPAAEKTGSSPQVTLKDPVESSVEIQKKLKEAEEALDKAEKSLKDKK
jgi:serine protease Do